MQVIDSIFHSPSSNTQGIWKFMSIALTTDRTKMQEPQDDFESFIYIMLYYGLFYLHYSKASPGLPNMISRIFDDSIDKGDETYGGDYVNSALAHSSAVFTLTPAY